MHNTFRHKTFPLSTILLTTLLLFGGCENAQRDLDSQVQRSAIDAGIGEQEQNQTANNPGIGTGDDQNSTVGEIKIDAKNAYKVKLTFSDNYQQKGYFSTEEVGKIHFDITNLYNDTPADTSVIESITLKAQELDTNSDGKYFNFIEFSGKEGPVYTIASTDIKSSDDVALKIKNLSGTTNLIFEAKIKKMPKPYIIQVPIVIEKSKSSSMAIVPIDTKYENGLFIDKFVIHVADSYGNKAKDGTSVSTGVINNPKLYSNALKEGTIVNENILYDIIHDHNTAYFKDDKGTLDRTIATFTLPQNSIDTTKDTISPLDTLIVLANKNQHKPYNLGGWDIASIDSDHQLSLISVDNGEKIDGVNYVIGDEYRYDACNNTLMNAAASSFETTEVKDGLAFAELRYVPAMVGKTVFIYANSEVDGKHIGISRKVTLKGLGLSHQTLSCNYKNTGPHCSMRFKLLLNGPKEETPAQNLYLEQPVLEGDPVYSKATASQTDCDGWTTVTIYNIEENQTATVGFGTIVDELIHNQK